MPQTENLIAFLRDQIGKPYILGSAGPDTYDCSGLTYTAFKEKCNIELPRSSTDQYGSGEAVEKNNLREGDMVFFDTGWSERNPDHCGVYTGNGNFINANSYYNSVKEEKLDSTYWGPLYYGARRILNETNNNNSSNASSSSTSNSSSSGSNTSNTNSSSITSNNTNVLKKGDNNDTVKNLQESLKSYGYLDKNTTSTGYYGDQTVKAVTEFQITYQIISASSDSIAGIYEENTKNILQKLSAPFSDVPLTHAYARYIAYLSKRNIVEGYAGEVFKPEQNINRAEALKIILTTFNIASTTETTLPFTDVKKTDWFYPYVKTAYLNNIVSGYDTPQGKIFKPGDSITRAEAIKIIINTGNISLVTETSVTFTDNKTDGWYYEYINTAIALGMLISRTKNTIEPNAPITREELCRAIVKADLLIKYNM